MVGDTASRKIETRAEWTLHKEIFQSICQKFYKPELNLFASRLNHQVPQYVFTYPNPGVLHLAVDAFLQDWSKWSCLIHPSVVLLPWMLKKVRADQATALFITPNWAGQPWFPELLQMLVDLPPLLPPTPMLVVPSISACSLTPLVAISSNNSLAPIRDHYKATGFSRKLLTSYWLCWEQPPRSSMQASGRPGFAVVLNGVSVPIQLLPQMSLHFFHPLLHKGTWNIELLSFTSPLSLRLMALLALHS